MGEAKRRRLQQGNGFEELDARLKADGVNTSQFGFYDQPAFLAKEQADPRYQTNYAEWVMLRPRDDTYDDRVRRIVPDLAGLVADAFIADKYEGSCIGASGMISRILDRLGIWSFAVIGGAVFEVASQDIWRGLATVDFAAFPNAVLGHAWVIAPPFQIVDAAIYVQRWGADPITRFLPRSIVAEDGTRLRPTVRDVVSDEMREHYMKREGRADPKLHYRLEPDLANFGRKFPAVTVTRGEVAARYVPISIRQTDVPLEQINSLGTIGRNGQQIWQQVVEPRFGSDVVEA
jgi:hypothetical protein